jgi:hypothetical protein
MCEAFLIDDQKHTFITRHHTSQSEATRLGRSQTMEMIRSYSEVHGSY